MMFIFACIVFYTSMMFIDKKVDRKLLSTKSKLLITLGLSIFYPITLTLGAICAFGLYYHKNIKQVPWISTALKKVENYSETSKRIN